MKAKKRLKNFDFSGQNAHMALVDEPANGIKTLITKAVDIDAMTDVQKESLKQIIKSANGFSEEEAQAYIEQLSAKDAGGDNPVSDIEKGNVADKTLPDNQENTMSEMIEKSAVEALIQKALEEKQAEIEKAVAEKESKIEELTKSLQAFEAEKAEAKKAEYVAKAADFEVLGVEDKESFGVALMKMSEQEELAGVMSVLEKAVQIAKGVEGLGEMGHDLEPQEEQISKTAELLKAKYGSK
jgi:vacuolar-type H+-ATPase subunit I/STV1